MGHLTLSQRYKIEAYREAGKGVSAIGIELGKDKSVISRELKRNKDERSGVYRAELAQRKTEERHKKKAKKIYLTAEVSANISYYLNQEFSPEQIVGRSKIEGKAMVSTERIYQHIWADKRKGGSDYKYLRTKGKKYKKRRQSKGGRGIIRDRIDIDQRPKIVEAKERIGDLEIDLIIGKGHKEALLTINDRATGLLFMDKVASKEAVVIEAKTIELLQDWKPLIHTITSDNGKEFANHKVIAKELDISFYFAKPYHSWQRGANENLNGLVRQYFPKNMSFQSIDKSQINKVVHKLNNRPRKRFGFKTPNEVFVQKLDKFKNVAFIC